MYLETKNKKRLSLEQKVLKSETLHSGSKERLKHLSDTIKLMKQSSVETKTLHDATVDLKSQIFRVTAESKLSEMRIENEKLKLKVQSDDRYIKQLLVDAESSRQKLKHYDTISANSIKNMMQISTFQENSNIRTSNRVEKGVMQLM